MTDIKELKDDELNIVVGGGSTFSDSEQGCNNPCLCLTWLHYRDGDEDTTCKCWAFDKNDPVCLNCTHAPASQK